LINEQLQKGSTVNLPKTKASRKRPHHSNTSTPDLSTNSDDSDARKHHKLKRQRGHTPEQINVDADSSELEEVYNIPSSEDEGQLNAAGRSGDKNKPETGGHGHEDNVVSWGDRSAKA